MSDTVTFRHHTLEIPMLSTEDRIIHCLQALVKAVRADKSLESTNTQMLAIESLWAIFKPPASTNSERRTSHTNQQMDTPLSPPPRVDNLPNSRQEDWIAPPKVANNTPTLPIMVAAPRVPVIQPCPIIIPQTNQPIAHHTRSSAKALVVIKVTLDASWTQFI